MMKTKNLILPALALGCAASLLVPAQRAGAFTTTGGFLDQTQRDFRVFNNFSDFQANDNTTPDSQFPGYTGAVLAIWKGSVEWGSGLHGDGSGDPTQPGDLGSGGANFDPSFQGEAPGVGGLNDNVHSELNGSAAGTFAFTEIPSSDGWRTRYFSAWVWDDGPGVPPAGQVDLQGTACRMYGFALGLGHSAVPGATMFPVLSDNGSSARSIEADDIAGIQFIYGVSSASKPLITNVGISGSAITVTGSGFSATNNQLWFTRTSPNLSGEPIKVVALTSNGTSLTTTIPAGAAPGDILVRNNGTASDDLSNAFPTDLLTNSPCARPARYCISAPNSVGAGARIESSGTISPSVNNFALECSGLPTSQFGIFFYGNTQVQGAFGDGVLCVVGDASGGIVRFPPVQANSSGFASLPLDFNAAPINSGSGKWEPGTSWNAQFWYRDPAAAWNGFNLSDALEFTICP